jgi:hypothetical protein
LKINGKEYEGDRLEFTRLRRIENLVNSLAV